MVKVLSLLLSVVLVGGNLRGQVVIDYSSILGPAWLSDVEVGADGSIWVSAIRGGGKLLEGRRGGYVAKLAPDGSEILGVKLFPDGAFGETWPWRIAATPDGGVIVVGQTSVDGFETPGPLGGAHRGRGDAFAAKIDPDGLRLEWATLLGGFEPDVALDVELDSEGRIVIVGNTTSPDFPADRKIGAGGIPSFVASDWFLARYSPDGEELLETVLFGGSESDGVGGLAIDDQGRVLIAGTSGSNDFPVPADAPRSTGAILLRYDPARATVDFQARLGGSDGSDGADAVWINPDGEAVIVGHLRSSDFPTLPKAPEVGFLFSAIYDLTSPEPNEVYRFGGLPRFNNGMPDNFEVVRDLAPAPDGGAWLTGLTAQEEFVPTDSGLVACPFPIRYRPWTGVVARLDAEGRPVRLLRAGGEATDSFFGVAVGPDALVHLAGQTESAWFPTGPRGFIADRTDKDGFVFAFDPKPVRSDRFLAAVVSGAGFSSGPIAPGQIVSLFGSRFGPNCPAAFSLDDDGRVPAELAETTVTFNRRPAPVLFANEHQINAIVPDHLGDERGALVQVEYAGMRSNVLTAATTTAAPALFTIDESGQAAALNQNGTVNSAQAPAAPGSVLSLFGTGMGRMDPLIPAGEVVSPTGPLPRPRMPVHVDIGGEAAEVLYAGAAPGLVSAVFQVNVRVPADVQPGEAVETRVSVADQAGPAAHLAIE